MTFRFVTHGFSVRWRREFTIVMDAVLDESEGTVCVAMLGMVDVDLFISDICARREL